jgi:hypothetical protein
MTKPTFLRSAAAAGTEPGPVLHEIEAAADRLGFVDRAPTVTVRAKKRKTVEEPTTSFTCRISVASANAFIRWTEEQGMSYREGFDHLMKLLAQNPAAPQR